MTDRETGDPIEGAGVSFTQIPTDASGHYSVTHLGLGENNSPIESLGWASKNGYWQSAFGQVALVCDQVSHLDFTLLRWQPAHVHGVVVEGTPDPNDPNVVIPGNTAIGDAGVGLEGNFGGFDTSVADGTFGFDVPHLLADNAPLPDAGLNAFATGYWTRGFATPSPIPIGDLHHPPAARCCHGVGVGEATRKAPPSLLLACDEDGTFLMRVAPYSLSVARVP